MVGRARSHELRLGSSAANSAKVEQAAAEGRVLLAYSCSRDSPYGLQL